MRLELSDQDALSRLPWRDLKSYLDSLGWRVTDRLGDKSLVYEPAEGSSVTSEILVPARDDLGDYAPRMAEAVQVLADAAQRSVLEVYREITTMGLDAMRLRAPNTDADGAIGIEDGVTL